ncbi:anhydro-N-acetylmuramic acid kinase [bacterium]|nr:anhydro-N-acetylmuramic acid kinase [bacterium]
MTLIELAQKTPKLVVGLMSGTSADGIDAALVRLSDHPGKRPIHLLGYATFSHPPALQEKILQIASNSMVAANEVCGLNVLLAQEFSQAVFSLCEKLHVRIDELDLIGSHGQTIRHLAEPMPLMGRKIISTWQIGDPSTIAKLTGVTTVGDFRLADMALGGQGAPLVPILDYVLFRSEQESRLCLNIGGISNVTFLPKGASPEAVLAFDCGPGNMLIDAAARQFFAQPFDQGGILAAQGRVDERLIRRWLQEPFYRKPPPKSTGRELFNSQYLNRLKQEADTRGLSATDFMATVTALTADAVFDQYQTFIRPKGDAQRIIVSGGGCRNPQLMQRLSGHFVAQRVQCSDEAGWPSEAKEAVCFAWLANEALRGRNGNLPSATGARRATVLGKICPGE